MQVARDEGLDRVNADILGENREMQSLCTKLGFRLEWPPGENTVRARITLR